VYELGAGLPNSIGPLHNGTCIRFMEIQIGTVGKFTLDKNISTIQCWKNGSSTNNCIPGRLEKLKTRAAHRCTKVKSSMSNCYRRVTIRLGPAEFNSKTLKHLISFDNMARELIYLLLYKFENSFSQTDYY
jgi:hypothetical protein